MFVNMVLVKIICVYNFFFVLVTCRTNLLEHEGKHYENNWSVRIIAGQDIAERIADQEGFHIFKENPALPHIYRFYKPDYPDKTDTANHDIARKLKSYREVSWIAQHIAVERKSKGNFVQFHLPSRFVHSRRSVSCPRSKNPNAKSSFVNLVNDELFLKEWYLQECRENADDPPSDINVVPVWYEKGYNYFGKGIVVVVIDDGLHTAHIDLKDNYNPEFGLDLQQNDNTPDPVPHGDNHYSHGTRCAGVIAMKANNKICGVGIAPLATIGAVRLLGPLPASDAKESRAMAFKQGKVDVYSNSWGPNDDGLIMTKIGPETQSAFKSGIQKGRGGRGSVYIFAAGNGKAFDDNCGADPYVSSIYTIAVASCDQDGKITNYSERCASIMVTTYSGDRSTSYNVVTTDVGEDIRRNNKCTIEHNGTSASAPMVAAAVALALEANKNLTNRAIQHGLTWTSQRASLDNVTPGVWQRNGAGFYVSHDFGFGLLDVFKLVDFAKTFQGVPPQNTCVLLDPLQKTKSENYRIFDRNQPFKIQINTNACKGSPSEVNYLEHVQLTVSVQYPKRGDLQVSIISPFKTVANLLERRKLDTSSTGLNSWSFDSVMSWGESPRGMWTIIISVAKEASSKHSGIVKDLSLIFHGTKQKPQHYEKPRPYYKFR